MSQEIISEISLSSLGLYLALILAGVMGWRWWKQKNHYRSLSSVPSPPRHWLLGNIPQVLAAAKQKKYFQLLFDWSQQFGQTYVIWLDSPMLILSQPKVIENTIINGIKDGSFIRSQKVNDIWNDQAGPILFGLDGSEWQWRRQAWNPEFSSRGLSKYIEVIDIGSSQVIEKLKEAKLSEVVKVDPLFVELTMRVIAYLLIGIPIDRKSSSLERPALDIQKIYDAMSVFNYRIVRLVTGERRWQKYLPTKSSRDYWSAKQYLDSFLHPYVDLALQLRENKLNNSEQISHGFCESMLAKIATKEPRYNQETLTAEAIEIFIAGTDTTAHTLSFAVGELALNPRVFQQAQSIVDQAWASQGKLNVEVLKQLNYIRAIVKESLRLYPVGLGSNTLQATRDTIIEGIKVPRGTEVFWSLFGAGRDPEIYPQPEEFLPERWLGEKGSNSLPVLQFGSGYHRCLGEPLAMLESTIMLAQLLRYFNWELVNGRSSLENLEQNLLVYPSDGVPVRFQLR